MSYFVTRVVLHHTSVKEDYSALHAAMESNGFSRTVWGDDGKQYHLPPAEYLLMGSHAIADVRASAVRAATSTGKYVSVLVTEGSSLNWQGLTVVS